MSSFQNKIGLPDIDIIDQRDRLYFDRYAYKLTFKSKGLRFMLHSQISENLYQTRCKRTAWFSEIPECHANFYTNRQIMQQVDWARDHQVKVRRDADTVSFFALDPETLKNIQAQLPIRGIRTQVLPVLQRGIVYISRDPRFQYRARMKNPGTRVINETFRSSVRGFVDSYAEYIQPSSGLRKFIDPRPRGGYRYWSLTGCSFDFNDQKLLTVVSLTLGDVITGVFEIQRRPDLVLENS